MSYPKLAVMADPKDGGKHSLHDNRWIVTEGTEVEWTFDGRDWRVKDGSLIAMMRDCQKQYELARLFAAAPELLEALEECVNRMEQVQKMTDYPLAWPTVKARHAIAKARGF